MRTLVFIKYLEEGELWYDTKDEVFELYQGDTKVATALSEDEIIIHYYNL